MPEVYLDGVRLDFKDTDGAATIGDMVEAIEREIKPLRRFVGSMREGALPVEDWRKTESLSRRLSDVAEIRFATVFFDALSTEGVETLREYIRILMGLMESAARGLDNGAGPAAEIKALTDGAAEVISTLSALARGASVFGETLFSRDPGPACQTLAAGLKGVSNALSGGKAGAAAAMLRDNIAPALSELERTLPNVRGG